MIAPGLHPSMVDRAEQILVANAETLKLFQRANDVIRVIVMSPEAAARAQRRDGVERPAGAVIIHRLSAIALREMLDRLIQWVFTTVDGEERIRDCPDRVAATYLARVGLWKLPILTGLIEAPILRPDGTVLNVAGYDRDTGLFLDCDDHWPIIPQNPSRADAEAALKELMAPFAQFPWVGDEHKSVFCSGILTALQRRLLASAPLHGFSAHVQRTGKSLLVESIGIIATGRKPAAKGVSRSPEELRKAITSTLREGHLIANLDNVVGPLDSPDLARAITQSVYADRLLGVNSDVILPTNVLWVATGNNLTFKGDMSSRALICEIDANVEHPEERTFQIGDLYGHLQAHRKQLVTAALTILRAFRVAGCPPQKFKPMGGFDQWSREVRAPLVWLGLADPCVSRQRIVVNDPDREYAAKVLRSWAEVFGNAAKLAREVIEAAAKHPELRKALLMVSAQREDPEQIDARRLGHWLAKTEGRVIDGIRLFRDREIGRATAWRVMSCASSVSFKPLDPGSSAEDNIYRQKAPGAGLSESNSHNSRNSLHDADGKSADSSNAPPIDSESSDELHSNTLTQPRRGRL
jgi:hypothetical protein